MKKSRKTTSTGSGTSDDFATIKYSQTPIGIDQTENTLPEKYSLLQNYPNPFNPTTIIRYSVPSVTLSMPVALPSKGDALVQFKVYDILGNEVATLVDGIKPAGSYEAEFDGSALSTGVYYYQLKIGSLSQTRKMILIK